MRKDAIRLAGSIVINVMVLDTRVRGVRRMCQARCLFPRASGLVAKATSDRLPCPTIW